MLAGQVYLHQMKVIMELTRFCRAPIQTVINGSEPASSERYLDMSADVAAAPAEKGGMQSLLVQDAWGLTSSGAAGETISP